MRCNGSETHADFSPKVRTALPAMGCGEMCDKTWRSSSLNKSRRHHHYPRAHVVDFVQPIRSSAASDAAPIACTLHVFLRAEFLIKGSRLGLIQSAIAAVHDEIVAFKKTRLKEL